MTPLLSVRDLQVRFGDAEHGVRAVDGVSLELRRGETLGIVGESGSGKSLTALSLIRLIAPPGRIVAGAVSLEGRDLLAMGRRELDEVRGREIAMIFQDPMTSLNPVLTIGRQVTEILEIQGGLSPSRARRRAIELLDLVGIPTPERRLSHYPQHFSGGMRQRVMIAMAVACRPKLLIADEPTTALDVTIQAQILELLRRLQQEFGMAMILITHDLGVAAGMADRIAVMYGGRIVEQAETRALFARPAMPYTAGLLAATPRLDRPQLDRLVPIQGSPPEARGPTIACRFAPRCPIAQPQCRASAPALRRIANAHDAACHLAAAAA
jgi:oligopeptide transport system ATP-binding protein